MATDDDASDDDDDGDDDNDDDDGDDDDNDDDDGDDDHCGFDNDKVMVGENDYSDVMMMMVMKLMMGAEVGRLS